MRGNLRCGYYRKYQCQKSDQDIRLFARTINEGDTCVRDLYISMPVEYAQVVCVKGYLRERLAYIAMGSVML